MQAEGLTQDVLEVGAALETLEGDGDLVLMVGAKGVEDDPTEFVEDGRMADETVKHPADKGSCRVPARREEAQNMVADFAWIWRSRDQGLEEVITLLVSLVGLSRICDCLVAECVQDGDAFFDLPGSVEPV